MSRYQSLLLRASREASRLSTNPTRSKPISVIRYWKPDRCSVEATLLPRSSSITCTRSDGQPSWVARSTNWYCIESTLTVMENLAERRLPDIDIRELGEVDGCDL